MLAVHEYEIMQSDELFNHIQTTWRCVKSCFHLHDQHRAWRMKEEKSDVLKSENARVERSYRRRMRLTI
jgi:hypothetical protein